MFEERIQRLFQATGVQTDSELARVLDIQPPSVAGARKRQLLPGTWVEKIALDYKISADWLLFGRGLMHLCEVAPEISQIAQDSTLLFQREAKVSMRAQETPCARCIKLEAEVELERHERRELAVEIRQLTAEIRQSTEGVRQTTAKNHELTSENRNLWKEICDLREKCARFEERQYQRTSQDGGEAVGSA